MTVGKLMGSRFLHISVPDRISDEELIDALQKFSEEIGDVPSQNDMNERGPHAGRTYRKHFGSWSEALETAGLDISSRKNRHRKVSTQQLLDGIHDFADELGRRPTSREMELRGPYTAQTYRARFGTWKDALREAGFDPSVRIETATLISELQNLAERVGGVPTEQDMDLHGEYSVSVYRDRFGTWSNAREVANVASTSTRRDTSSKEVLLPPPQPSEADGEASGDLGRRHPSEHDHLQWRGSSGEIPTYLLITDLQFVAAQLGYSPSGVDYQNRGSYASSTFQSRFGSWDRALVAAGLAPRGQYLHTETELINTLQNLAEQKGRSPYAQEIEDETEHSHNTYQDRFGSWNEALEAAGLELNRRRDGGVEVECWNCGETFHKKRSAFEDTNRHFCDADCMGKWESENYRGEGNPRWAGGYENYYGENWEEARRETLSRDDFSCESCGLGRKDHVEEFGRDLHVHHIQPMRTFDTPEESNTLDNLVTLCESCHSKWEGIPLRPQRAD